MSFHPPHPKSSVRPPSPDPWDGPPSPGSSSGDSLNLSCTSALKYIGENVLTHPFLVLRRGCQIHVQSKQTHRTPLTLMLPMVQLYSGQGFSPFWKGLSSSLAVKWMLLGTEDFISKFTPWEKVIDENSSVKKICGNLLLKSISLAFVTPFKAASIIETVESDLVPDDSNVLEFVRVGINRLLNWSQYNRRLLPAWVLIPPTVAAGLAHYIIANGVQALSIRLLAFIRSQREQITLGAVPKRGPEDSNAVVDSYEFLLSSLLGNLAADVILYPLDTVLVRLHVQGSRAIADDMDTGYEVFPVLSAYSGFMDCVRTIRAEEGNGGFFKGFGTLFLQYGLLYVVVRWSSIIISQGQKFYNTQVKASPPPAASFLDMDSVVKPPVEQYFLDHHHLSD